MSDIIKDKRTHEALKIVDFSESTAPTKGGKKIVIFTGKICKDDIEVHFSFENSEYNPNMRNQISKKNFLLHIHIMLFNKSPYSIPLNTIMKGGLNPIQL